jgi:hypothetical protein
MPPIHLPMKEKSHNNCYERKRADESQRNGYIQSEGPLGFLRVIIQTELNKQLDVLRCCCGNH